MKFGVLVTRNSERWANGVDHLLVKGLWLRLYRKKSGKKANSKKLYGDLMCLDLVKLKTVGELLSLEHLKLDKKLSKKGQKIKVHLFRMWGSKLQEFMSYVHNAISAEEPRI